MSIFSRFKRIRVEEEIRGYILYFFDIEKWESNLYPLPRIEPIVKLKKYREIVRLDKVGYYLNGKPVYIVIRSVPFSLEFELSDEEFMNKEIDPSKVKNESIVIDKVPSEIKDNITLRLKDYTSSEIDAKISSIYTNSVFRRSSFNGKDAIFLILSVVISIISTVLAMFIWHTTEIQKLMEAYNLIGLPTTGVVP